MSSKPLKFGNYILVNNEEFGRGAYGQICLATNECEKESEKKLYIIKIPKFNSISQEEEKLFNDEIDIINILSHTNNNKFTSIIYDFKKFNLERKKQKKKEDKNEIKKQEESKENKNVIIMDTPYYIMDYFSKGILQDYIESFELEEIHKKFIFKRLIEGFQFLHNNNICHLDIKPLNIVMDKDFWPVIIDFGFSKKFRDENGDIIPLKDYNGSIQYAAPEIWEKKGYNGAQADIFRLGVVLFKLVTNQNYGFISSKKSDEKYKLIIKGGDDDLKLYWEQINMPELKEDFKKLYIKMVSHCPNERPSLGDILNSDWLKEVKELKKEEEDKIKTELNNIYEDEIKSQSRKLIKIDDKINNEKFNTKSFEDKKNLIFQNNDLKAKKISKDRLSMNKFIKINGNLNEVNFMNSLIEKIKNEFNEGIPYIKGDEESLKFEIEFEEEEEKEDCKMDIELFKVEDGKYLLEFRRTGGKYDDYYNYFMRIKKLLKKNIFK